MTLREHTGRTILDYVKDAINGCNPDVEGKLNANLFCF